MQGQQSWISRECNVIKSVLMVASFLIFSSSARASEICGAETAGATSAPAILFVNGIGNDPIGACDSLTVLKQRLQEEGAAPSDAAYKLFHNPTQSLAADVNELRIQAALSAIARKLSAPNNTSDYWRYLALAYEGLIRDGVVSESACIDSLQAVYDPFDPRLLLSNAVVGYDSRFIKNLCVRVYATAGRLAAKMSSLAARPGGKGLVVVAHSQGNFYVEAAYAMLLARREPNIERIRVVGIAAISSTTPNNSYETLSQDNALFRLQMANTAMFRSEYRAEILPATADACLVLALSCTESDGANVSRLAAATATATMPPRYNLMLGVLGGGFADLYMFHEFANVYLNHQIRDSRTGEKMVGKIANRIKDAIRLAASGGSPEVIVEWKPSVAEIPWRNDGQAIDGWWTYSHLPYYGYVQLVRIKLPSPQRIGDLKIGFKVRNSGANCDVHMLVGNEQPIPGDSTNMYPYYSWYNCMMTPGPIEREIDLSAFPVESAGIPSCPDLYRAFCNQDAIVSYVLFHFRDAKDLDYIRVKSRGVTILEKDF
jgi:hypothetical protein